MQKLFLIVNFLILSLCVSSTSIASVASGNTAYRNGDYEQALRDWLVEAEKGNPEVQTAVARMYLYAQGIPRNYGQALRWFKAAANQNNIEGQFNLAEIYYKGWGVDKNYAEAARWYRAAAEQGHIKAQYEIALFYYRGRGIVKDLNEAARWMRAAADQKHLDAQHSIGVMYAEGHGVPKNEAEAVRWYLLAADRSYGASQGNLGAMYFYGRGVVKNLAKAYMWWQISIVNGDETASGNLTALEGIITPQQIAEAQYLIAIRYDDMFGVDYNQQEARRLFRLSANQGYAAAQFEVGNIYRKWTDKEAWYLKSADQGYGLALLKLADVYAHNSRESLTLIAAATNADSGHPLGTFDDLAKAFNWYRLAANLEVVEAQYELFRYYQSSALMEKFGLRQDKPESMRLLKLSAQGDYYLAQSALANAYKFGIDVNKNLGESFRLYGILANSHKDLAANYYGPTFGPEDDILEKVSKAQIVLGSMYANGQGTTKDLVLALKWFYIGAGTRNLEQKIGAENWSLINGTMSTQQQNQAMRLYQEWDADE